MSSSDDFLSSSEATFDLGPRAAVGTLDEPPTPASAGSDQAAGIPVDEVVADLAVSAQTVDEPPSPVHAGAPDSFEGTLDESNAAPTRLRSHFLTGRVVGRYFIEEEIGEGGMGTVYRAKQLEPVKRTVALKMIRTGRAGHEAVQRFLAERQALAMMEHPDIARILDAGTEDDQPYFVMEYADGEPLDQFCRRNQLGIQDRVRLVVRVCRAIQHAHEKGVIHRDIKPSNVLVSRVQGQPVVKVIDFGIAKALDCDLCDDGPQTSVGQMVGTPLYMSPEQAGGAEIDARVDVYSLGATLYTLLTGHPPLTLEADEWKSLSTIVRRVTTHESEAPSTVLSRCPLEEIRGFAADCGTTLNGLRRQLRGDLTWIVLRALAPQRQDRYATAGDLADELQCYLESRPVRAAAPTLRYRASRFARRHRTLVSVAAAIGVTAFLATAVGGAARWNRQQAEQQQQQNLAGDIRGFLADATTALQQPTTDVDLWRANLELASGHLAQAETLLPQLKHAAAFSREARSLRNLLNQDFTQAAAVQELFEARDLGVGADPASGGRDTARSVSAVHAALAKCGVAPVQTIPKVAVRRLQAFPPALHAEIVESLDFLINEDTLGTGITCELHNESQVEPSPNDATEIAAVDSRGTLLIDFIENETEADIEAWAEENDSPSLYAGLKLLALRDAGDSQSRPLAEADFVDVTACTPDEITQRFAGEPGTTVEVMVESAEHGRYVVPLKRRGAEAFWAAAVLKDFDPHPWRTKLRTAILAADHQTLRELAIVDDLESQSAFSLVLLASKLPEPERSTDAIRVLYAAQEAHSDNYWANMYLGLALQFQARRTDTLEAARFYTAATALNPASPRAYQNIAMALLSMQRFYPAIMALKRAVEIAPEEHNLRFSLARILHHMGRFDEAVPQYEELIRRTPDDPDLLPYLGEIYEAQGRVDDQVRLYQQAVELDPTATSPHYRLARALRLAGREAEADSTYDRILQECQPDLDGFRMIYSFHPEKADAPFSPDEVRETFTQNLTTAERHKWMGYVLLQITEPPAALSALQESLRQNTNDADTHYFAALTHELLHDSEAAIAELQQSVKLAPEHPFAQTRLTNHQAK